MAFQQSLAMRTGKAAVLQALLTAAGGTAQWKIFSGGVPANCAASDPAGLLVTGNLPSPALTAASGSTAIIGTWPATAAATGVANCARLYDGAGVCHWQGNTATDMVLSNQNITIGQVISVIQFSVAENGA